MQGYQIVLYENAEERGAFKYPFNADRILKWWRATYEEAEELKREVQREYDGIVKLKRRT